MRLMKSFFVCFVAIVAMAFAATPSFAQGRVQVDIEQGHLNPMPVAVIDFLGANAAAQQVGRDISGVVRADLERSGLFRSVAPDAFIERFLASGRRGLQVGDLLARFVVVKQARLRAARRERQEHDGEQALQALFQH